MREYRTSGIRLSIQSPNDYTSRIVGVLLRKGKRRKPGGRVLEKSGEVGLLLSSRGRLKRPTQREQNKDATQNCRTEEEKNMRDYKERAPAATEARRKPAAYHMSAASRKAPVETPAAKYKSSERDRNLKAQKSSGPGTPGGK